MPPSGKRLLTGSTYVILADGLLIPTGLLTVVVLTRYLGPDGYGLLTLVATIIGWVEWTIPSCFSRATIKLVADVDDWQDLGSAVLRLQLIASLVAMVLVWLLSPVLTRALNEPRLLPYLVLFALDIPLFTLGQGHRSILIGIGEFEHRAIASASRWVSRLLLVTLLVALGLSVYGAILGSMAASVVELAMARRFVRPSLFGRAALPPKHFWAFALPLATAAIGMRTFDRLDLLALTSLGGTAELAGIYGATQNLVIIPGLVAAGVAPGLVTMLSRMLRTGRADEARRLERAALRGSLFLIPLAGVAAGAARDIVSTAFGSDFQAGGPLFTVLIFGAVALGTFSVALAILTAEDRPGLTAVIVIPLVGLAGLGYLVVIPPFGALGAAAVTSGVSIVAAVVGCVVVRQVCGAAPPWGTMTRSAGLCVVAYVIAVAWPASDAGLVTKFLVLGIGIPVGYAALGEFTSPELGALVTAARDRLSVRSE